MTANELLWLYDNATDTYTDNDITDKLESLTAFFRSYWAAAHPTDTTEYDWQAVAKLFLAIAAKEIGSH